jgi:hypothetical protein
LRPDSFKAAFTAQSDPAQGPHGQLPLALFDRSPGDIVDPAYDDLSDMDGFDKTAEAELGDDGAANEEE